MCYHGLIGSVRPSAAGTGRRGDEIAFPLCRAAGFSRHEGGIALCLPEDLSDIVVGELDVRPPCLVHGGEQSFGKQRHGTVTVWVGTPPPVLEGTGGNVEPGEKLCLAALVVKQGDLFHSSHLPPPVIDVKPGNRTPAIPAEGTLRHGQTDLHSGSILAMSGSVERSSSVLRTILMLRTVSSRQEAIFLGIYLMEENWSSMISKFPVSSHQHRASCRVRGRIIDPPYHVSASRDE